MGDFEYLSGPPKKGPTKEFVLVLMLMTVPFLWRQCEQRDCYNVKTDCEKDWGGTDCESNPEPRCPYVGRVYHGFWGGDGARTGSGSHSIGISRGGFGATGHGFGHGGW